MCAFNPSSQEAKGVDLYKLKSAWSTQHQTSQGFMTSTAELAQERRKEKKERRERERVERAGQWLGRQRQEIKLALGGLTR